jgi:hypothetical protein
MTSQFSLLASRLQERVPIWPDHKYLLRKIGARLKLNIKLISFFYIGDFFMIKQCFFAFKY